MRLEFLEPEMAGDCFVIDLAFVVQPSTAKVLTCCDYLVENYIDNGTWNMGHLKLG